VRLIVAAVLAVPLLGWTGTAFAQPAPSPLFGQTCTGSFGSMVVRHVFFVPNGMPVVHVWAKVPNGKNVFGDGGEASVTINQHGSLQFTTNHGYRTTVVPDGKGKAEATIAGMGNRSATAEYDQCVASTLPPG
jgi:hypothetical protein